MEKLKICLVSVVQTSFWGSSAEEYKKKYIPEMKKLSEQLEFELLYIENPIGDIAGANNAKEQIDSMGADFLLIQLSTFAAGELLLPLAETGLRIGLWGVPEITGERAIPNNSLCGVNMYGSILKQYLRRENYKWFFGTVDDDLFLRRFKVTVSALTAIKRLKGAKVALIGGIAPGFYDFCYDERLALEKLGVKVNSLIEFGDIYARVLSYPESEIKEEAARMQAEYTCVGDNLEEEHLETSTRVYRAFKEVLAEGGFDAAAISCWPKYRKNLGIVICSVIGRLLENGITAACEGDVDSAITMLLLKSLTGKQPMLMDLSKFDETDQTILMWHCGSAPKSYADKDGVSLAMHYKPGSRVPGEDSKPAAAVNSMSFAAGPVTVARLTNDYKNMLLFSGEIMEKADKSYDGSRGWIGGLHVEGEAIGIRELINSVLSNGFQHHYAIVGGHVENEMREIMAWLGIKPFAFLKYQDYLQ